MHEASLVSGLIRKIEAVAGPARVVGVTVSLGALAHISADHFREHFQRAARGTAAEGARLEVEVRADPGEPGAQDVLLRSVEVEA